MGQQATVAHGIPGLLDELEGRLPRRLPVEVWCDTRERREKRGADVFREEG